MNLASGSSDLDDPRFEKLEKLENTKEVQDYLELIRKLRREGIFKDSLATKGVLGMEDPQRAIGHLGMEFTHRLPRYASFLPDGIFEFFMPATSLDKSSKEYKHRLCVMFWIASRFPDWQDWWWHFFTHLHLEYYQTIDEWVNSTDWEEIKTW